MRQAAQHIQVSIEIITRAVDLHAHGFGLIHKLPLRHLAPLAGFTQRQLAMLVQKQRQHALHGARRARAIQARAAGDIKGDFELDLHGQIMQRLGGALSVRFLD